MNHDLPQPLPSRIVGTQDAENSRIKCIADELRRRCGIYETQPGTSETTLSLADAEARASEDYAKENGLWVPMERLCEETMMSYDMCG